MDTKLMIALVLMLCCSSSSAFFLIPSEKPVTGPTGPTGPTTPLPIGLYTTSEGIRHQGNNPDDENLFWNNESDEPWDKYYKFSCKTSSGIESSKLGPYGPVTMGNYHGPKLRIGPDGTKPCGETNKMHIYRADESAGTYIDLTQYMKNLEGTSVYNGMDTGFLDIHS